MIHGFLIWIGITNASGSAYLFWSGFGADLSELSVLGAAAVFYRHRKCVSCWRIGKHHVEGTAWTTCHRHLTESHHDRLLAEYADRHPEQHAFLNTDRADSENLIEP